MKILRLKGQGIWKRNSGLCAGLLMLFPLLAGGQVTLVDFGSSAGGNTFGLAGWNIILKSAIMTYSSAGNDGLVTWDASGSPAGVYVVTVVKAGLAQGMKILLMK